MSKMWYNGCSITNIYVQKNNVAVKCIPPLWAHLCIGIGQWRECLQLYGSVSCFAVSSSVEDIPPLYSGLVDYSWPNIVLIVQNCIPQTNSLSRPMLRLANSPNNQSAVEPRPQPLVMVSRERSLIKLIIAVIMRLME